MTLTSEAELLVELEEGTDAIGRRLGSLAGDLARSGLEAAGVAPADRTRARKSIADQLGELQRRHTEYRAKLAEVEACVNDVAMMLPEAVAAAIQNVTVHVARDRGDVEVLRAAVRDARIGTAKIPQNFRAVFMGIPLQTRADEYDPLSGLVSDPLRSRFVQALTLEPYSEDEVAALGLE